MTRPTPSGGPMDAPGVAAGRLRDAVRARLFGEEHAPEPERIGRFEVGELLGRGGMGEVFRAHDPQLGRTVAIKLLRSDRHGTDGSAGQSRLLREAQAMARLSHPNVVTVYEAGMCGDRVFVAMEYVEGTTLRGWLRQGRSRADILEAFDQCAGGLAAAHGVGIVHRDFKPDNVMVGADGRARVMDFGLAFTTEGGGISHGGSGDVDGGPRATASAGIVGTPAYMAPEQHSGGVAGTRSDQFSFCVALYEALSGEHPFVGRTYEELACHVLEGRRRTSSDRAVPRRLRRVLLRGLEIDPERRFPSMHEMRTALRGASRRRGSWALGSLAATVVVSGWVSWSALRSPCAEAAVEIDAVWGPPSKTRLERVFTSGDLPYVAHAWRSTVASLDAYAHDWTRVALQVCATRSVGASDETSERQQRCLESRRDELAAFVDWLAAPDEGVWLEAAQVAATLPSVDACTDRARLGSWASDAGDERRAWVTRSQSALARARVDGGLGRYEEAVAAASEVATQAEQHGDPLVEASALLVRGQFEERLGGAARAETSLRSAIRLAEGGSAHELRAQALIRLVYVVGLDAGRFVEVERLAADAAAVLGVLGADPLLAAKLHTNVGLGARRAGHEARAIEDFEAALRGYRESHGDDHPETARAHINLGTSLARSGRLEDAEPHLLHAVRIFESALGPLHPTLAVALGALANLRIRQGRHDEAVKIHERTLAIRTVDFSTDHPAVARTLFNLGVALFESGRYEAAEGRLRRGLELAQGRAASPATLAPWWLTLGMVDAQRHEYARAESELDAALEARPDLDSLRVRTHRIRIAQALRGWDAARAVAEEARRDFPDPSDEDARVLAAWMGISDSLRRLEADSGGPRESGGRAGTP